MKPYYDKDGIVIYHGDCREVLPTLDFDVVVTDPPYGCAATTGRGGTYSGFSIAGDLSTDLRDWLIGTVKAPMVVFGSPRVPRPECKSTLIWSKGDHTGMGDLSFPWKPDFEEIYIIGEGFAGPRTSSVLCVNARIDSGRMHPTEKPIDLMTRLIRKCPGGTVLDPFMGSGTTLLAAKLDARSAIGIEIEERYCDTAAKRLSQGVLNFARANDT